MYVVLPVFVFIAVLFSTSVSADTPLAGHTIGIDAGHGGGESGAVGYCEGVPVAENLVNEAVRNELTTLIEAAGGFVHTIEQLPTRKARVADAEAGGSEILISIHHNGSSNVGADYTQSFVTQKNDRDLAKKIHPNLVSALQIADKGIKNDGYGMTVYGSLPGVLTESYFITNPKNACDFLAYKNGTTTKTLVEKEAEAMYNGLLEYFAPAPDDGGNTGGSCSPGKERQGKC